MKKNWFYFDMDGTLVDLYLVANWLPKLEAGNASPYRIALPMLDMRMLARTLNRLQKIGFQIGICSWLSKNSSPAYSQKVMAAKMKWLRHHLPSVKWDDIKFLPYGMNKWEACGTGILFDDESRNRNDWKGESYSPEMIMEVLNFNLKNRDE